ncbi:MAG: DUF3048 domain-containing protein [Georgenia sp.]
MAAALALVLAACSPSAPDEKPTVAPTTATTPTPSPTPTTPPPPPPTWPLTGLPREGELGPALSVKIENSRQSRPQTGLEDADVVWEEMVEGGITRFNAVYHSVVPEVLGPVRSARPMDAAISAPYGGVIAFSGGQPAFVEKIRATGLLVLSHDLGSPGFYRVRDRRTPHNVFATGPELVAQATDGHTTPPPEQLAFAADVAGSSAVVAGAPATVLAVGFPSSAPGWTWDPAAIGHGAGGDWMRDESGLEQLSTDGDRLAADNVVVLRVQIRSTGTFDPAGNPVPETILEGEGDALVASGGKVLAARWAKGGVSEPLRLTDAAGAPILLSPGNTWIELVPVDGGSMRYE